MYIYIYIYIFGRYSRWAGLVGFGFGYIALSICIYMYIYIYIYAQIACVPGLKAGLCWTLGKCTTESQRH